MFIRLKNDKVISLIGKGLDIIRLPDEDPDAIKMKFALVIVHNTANAPPSSGSFDDASDDEYWGKFEIIAECETHDAGSVRLGQPLEPLLDKICRAIDAGVHLFDLRTEKTYISFNEVLAMSLQAEIGRGR